VRLGCEVGGRREADAVFEVRRKEVQFESLSADKAAWVFGAGEIATAVDVVSIATGKWQWRLPVKGATLTGLPASLAGRVGRIGPSAFVLCLVALLGNGHKYYDCKTGSFQTTALGNPEIVRLQDIRSLM